MSPELDARLDAIVARQKSGGREGVRRDIEHLADLGVETVGDLQAICVDPAASVDARTTAIWFLGRLESDPGTLEALVAALGAPDCSVAGQAAVSLGLLDDPRAVGPLLAALAGDADPDAVRSTAAWALGMIGDHKAFPALVARLAPTEPESVRASCAEAIRNMGHPAAGPVLLAALDDPSPLVRYVTAVALHERRDPRALPRLRELAARDDGIAPHLGRVREAAAKAIVAIERAQKHPR